MGNSRANLRIGAIFIFFLLWGADSGEGMDIQGLVEHGRKYMMEFQFDKAIKNFEAAIEQNPNDAPVYCYLGKSYVGSLRYGIAESESTAILNKAKRAYLKSLEINPGQVCAYEGLGEYFTRISNYKEAIAQYKVVTQLQPENREVYREIGRMHLELNQRELAREAFLVFLNGRDSSLDYDKEYQLASVDRIKTAYGQIVVRSIVKWHVVDPIIYEGTIGHARLAETRIKDIYCSNLRRVVALVKNVDELLSRDSGREIVRYTNEYMTGRFGIELLDVDLNVADQS